MKFLTKPVLIVIVMYVLYRLLKNPYVSVGTSQNVLTNQVR